MMGEARLPHPRLSCLPPNASPQTGPAHLENTLTSLPTSSAVLLVQALRPPSPTMDLKAMWRAIAAARQSGRTLDAEISKCRERIRALEKTKQDQQGTQDQLAAVHGAMTWSAFDTLIVPYCKAWNSRFAKQILKRLPLELREMICKYLWMEYITNSSKETLGHAVVVLEHLNEEHFINPEYVGDAMALEVVIALHKAKTSQRKSTQVCMYIYFDQSSCFNAFLATGYLVQGSGTLVLSCSVQTV